MDRHALAAACRPRVTAADIGNRSGRAYGVGEASCTGERERTLTVVVRKNPRGRPDADVRKTEVTAAAFYYRAEVGPVNVCGEIWIEARFNGMTDRSVRRTDC